MDILRKCYSSIVKHYFLSIHTISYYNLRLFSKQTTRMNKTLLRTFNPRKIENIKNTASGKDVNDNNQTLANLVAEMNGVLKEVATDLLPPRPEALENLFRKLKQHH